MRLKAVSFAVLVAIFALLTSSTSASAIGKHKWWTTSVTGTWLSQGVVCSDNVDALAGGRAVVSWKYGQAKAFTRIETIRSISGATLLNEEGQLHTDADLEYGDVGHPICENGEAEVAFVSTKVPTAGGAYNMRWALYNSAGKFLWNWDMKVLKLKTGLESGSSFFSNPPSYTFPSSAYTAASYSGLVAYTSKGAKRNACLIFYDIALRYASGESSIYSRDLVSSLQRGSLGMAVRDQLGSSAIPTAIKCSPWVADYLW